MMVGRGRAHHDDPLVLKNEERDGRIWLCDVDVESDWARAEEGGEEVLDEQSLLLRHFEEILLPSLSDPDLALLRAVPDSSFLEYLRGAGLAPSDWIQVREAEGDPWAPTARLALNDSDLMREVERRVRDGRLTSLEPFGTTRDAVDFAERTGLRLICSWPSIAARLSRKSTARALTRSLGWQRPDGETCDDLERLPAVVKQLRRVTKGAWIVVKPDLAASGRGQRLVRSAGDLRALEAALGDGQLGGAGTVYVVERWYAARATAMYSFQVDGRGEVSGDVVVRRALGGAGSQHFGYVYPAGLRFPGKRTARDLAGELAAELHANHRYAGPVRCDALKLRDGRVFPLLEINARHSFYTYVDLIQQRLGFEGVGVFRWIFFRSPGHLAFDELVERGIGRERLFEHRRGEGVVIPVFQTLTAGESGAGGLAPLRRLFVLVLAGTQKRAVSLANEVRQRVLGAFPSSEEHRA